MTGQQLKNSILQMAVQGKLVPQDPNDEPASVLLERIRAEKEQLIKEGKIKKEKKPSYIFRGADNLPYEKVGKNEPVCIADEVPFEIPDSWGLIRLNDIGIYRKGPFGSTLTKSRFVNKGIDTVKVYEQKNAIKKDHTLGDYYITKKYYEEKMKSFSVKPGDIIVSCAGTIGETYVLPENIEQGIINQALMRMEIFDSINIDYFLLYFDYVLKESSKANSKGSAIKNIPPFDIFKKLLLPLPPLQEQVRIVQKTKELQPFIEKYDEVYLTVNSLNATFPEMLKKSILQQAVQGKLVTQNSSDEPASVLLERIRAEKQKLIAEGKIKKDKHESVIFRRDNSHYEIVDGKERCIDDEIPFDIPENWCWTRLRSIGETNIGLTYKPSDKVNEKEGIAVLRSNNIQKSKIDYTDLVYVSCNVPKRAMIDSGDILICARNGSRALVGKAAIVDKNGMAFGAFMAKYTSLLSGSLNSYILLFIESPVFRKQLDGVKTETINQITQAMLKAQLIPIPPLLEQHRIVEKQQELFDKITLI